MPELDFVILNTLGLLPFHKTSRTFRTPCTLSQEYRYLGWRVANRNRVSAQYLECVLCCFCSEDNNFLEVGVIVLMHTLSANNQQREFMIAAGNIIFSCARCPTVSHYYILAPSVFLCFSGSNSETQGPGPTYFKL